MRALHVLAKLDAAAFERIPIEWEIQRTGADGGDGADADDQSGSTPHVRDEQKAQLVSAQSLPSGRVLGTVAVGGKKQRDSRRKRVARPPWPSRRQARQARRASLLSTNPAPDPPRQRRGLPYASQRQAHHRKRGVFVPAGARSSARRGIARTGSPVFGGSKAASINGSM